MDKEFAIICPICILADAIQPVDGTEEESQEAVRCFANCAWYDEDNDCCAILTLAMKRGSHD